MTVRRSDTIFPFWYVCIGNASNARVCLCPDKHTLPLYSYLYEETDEEKKMHLPRKLRRLRWSAADNSERRVRNSHATFVGIRVFREIDFRTVMADGEEDGESDEDDDEDDEDGNDAEAFFVAKRRRTGGGSRLRRHLRPILETDGCGHRIGDIVRNLDR